MKKAYALIAMILAVVAMNAQTVKVMKAGAVVAEFGADEFDQVVFEPTAGQGLAGEYHCSRSVSVMGSVVLQDDGVVTVTQNADGTINLSFPTCYYEGMGDLPGVNASNVEVSEENGVYTFSAEYSDVDENDKAYNGTVSGSINTVDTWDYSFTVVMNYGSMPFPLIMEYVSDID